MATRNTAAITPNYTPAWVNVLEWEGLTPGDPVRVIGERGDFTFVSVHIKDDEVIAVNVHGGVHGHVTHRAFYPHKVTSKRSKRTRKTRSEDNTAE
jgi:hypothetical protein